MSVVEHPVVFECAGEALLGIVAAPPAPASVGVLILVGGPQYRIGSHRQYVTLTRYLAQHGIAAMRFDYRGMGDSSGEMRTFADIEADITSAIDAFIKTCPSLERIVLWGLCDAASASLIYWDATRDTRLAGMVLADPWVSEVSFAKRQVRHYLQRPLDPEFWLKLARGGVNVVHGIQSFLSSLSAVRPSAEGADGLTESELAIRMEHALNAYPGHVLMLLSGDLAAKNFVEHCQNGRTWNRLLRRGTLKARELPEADHTFSTETDRKNVETLTCEWVKSTFR